MKANIFFGISLLCAIPLSAQNKEQAVRIWPALAPGSESVENKEEWENGNSVVNVYQPDITVFPLEHQRDSAPAVVVFPGGGYRKVVMEKEGYKIARWLNENGIAAFVLKYRLDRDDALRDAQRTISLIRGSAETYKIDKDKIGVIGFSAGANLAANLAMNHHERERYDRIDDNSSRPDFWIGIYGRYNDIYGASGSIEDKRDVSPAFLVHAGNDSKVPASNSAALYMALARKNVPAELHIFEKGEHGFALEANRGPATTSTVNDWSIRCLTWLNIRGIL